MLSPISSSKWNYTCATHLLNRAGFGGTPDEIRELEALGPEKAVRALLDYERTPDPAPNPDWAQPDPKRIARFAAARKASEEERRMLRRQEQMDERERIVELRKWWLDRMATGPRPLQEKMVLFWHGHFATSVEKVRDAYFMWRQNELFRRLATGSWLQLLTEVAKDPAMLIWLDQAQSRKEKPNENFAREVMELFALGEGHYTEEDIAEGARALTGWSVDRVRQEFAERPYWHDPGQKRIFGQAGAFKGEDFLSLIVAQPQAGRFITAKLWHYFTGQEASEECVSRLAAVFRRTNNSFKPVLRTIFLSEAFYAPEIIRNQVKSPVQWLVGSVKLLEREMPTAQVCAGLTKNLGQDLFAPPNVKGWDGGLSWITTNNLLARYNQAAILVQGDLSLAQAMMRGRGKGSDKRPGRFSQVRPLPVSVEKLFTEKERNDKDALLAALQKRFLQSHLKAQQATALREYLEAQAPLNDVAVLNAIRLVMATPEYQLT
jgi:uncharacterized protein (DUF1800 family)